MRIFSFFYLIVSLALGDLAMANLNQNKQREIRTFIEFSYPIDPAHIYTIPDMDMSYALGSTLVDLDDSKSITAGLAARWSLKDEKTYVFELRKDSKWSNGTLITCSDVKLSFDRAKKVHGKNLQSLFSRIESIECGESNSVVIRLVSPEKNDSFLLKLVEPMYGVLKVKDSTEIDLKISSGPFLLEKASENEVTLKGNPHWYKSDKGLPEQVVIKRPPAGVELQSILLTDKWPNLIATHSLMSGAESEKLKQAHFEVWERNLDRVFLFCFLGRKKIEEDSQMLFQFLSSKLDRASITNGVEGFTLENQVFPRGYPIYDSSYKNDLTNVELPNDFKKRPLKILMSPARVSPKLKENISIAIQKTTGNKPAFIEVPLTKVLETSKKEQFDFYVGSYGVSDVNIDGALSFFFDSDFSVIPSKSGKFDFVKRITESRNLSTQNDRYKELRSIVTDAVKGGFVMPLFHYSTTVIARPEIDLSKVPTSDESVSFSKIRFRE